MAQYLKYIIRNIEPLRIADDSSSQYGQTASLNYIPGSAMRGVIINALALDADFASVKQALFSSKIRFLNAYPVIGDRELMPAPKGFYEDKTESRKKEIQNIVIDGSFKEGCKRSSMGDYCYFSDGCIFCHQPETGADMKIKMNLEADEKRNVFRNEYLVPGQRFAGYIALETADGEADVMKLAKRIRKVFDGFLMIGNGRLSGMGKCLTESCAFCGGLPFAEYMAKGALDGECYMMLLSDTVMRDKNGELCGIDRADLESQMGVTNLEYALCATSAVTIKGFNRKWGGKIPSAVMYQKGSVFHLAYEGSLKEENALRLMDRGIGIRRNEGFGRVIFLDGYEKIKYRQEADRAVEYLFCSTDAKAEDEDVLRTAAYGYYKMQLARAAERYVTGHPLNKGGIADSQLGQLASIAVSYQYDPQRGIDTIRKYLAHAAEKGENRNQQKEKHTICEIADFVLQLLDGNLEEILDIRTKKKDTVMGFPKADLLGSEEVKRLKLKLLIMLIRYDNKNGREVQ